MSTNALDHEQFAKTLTRFAQTMVRGDSAEAIALRSALVLDSKDLQAENERLRAALEVVIGYLESGVEFPGDGIMARELRRAVRG